MATVIKDSFVRLSITYTGFSVSIVHRNDPELGWRHLKLRSRTEGETISIIRGIGSVNEVNLARRVYAHLHL